MKSVKIVSLLFLAALLAQLPLNAYTSSYQNTSSNYSNSHKTSHSGAVHVFSGATEYYDYVQLEDGSLWQVNPQDAYKVQNWSNGALLEVLQNDYYNYKPTYMYKLYNVYSSNYVEVNLGYAPVADNQYTVFIADITKPDYGDGTMTLSDGSVWELNSIDDKAWRGWRPYDILSVGINDAGSYSYPNILINATYEQKHTRAKCKY